MGIKVVIIGGGAAGPKTAAKLRRERPDMQIDLYTQENIISYSACGLPYFIENIIQDAETLILRTSEDFKKNNTDIHILHKCLRVDTVNKKVLIENLETGAQFEKEYDILVIASGAVPIVPDIEGINLKNIFTLRTIQDGINIKEKMRSSKKAVLLGGGYISIELMEALTANNIETCIIEKDSQILKVLDEELALIVQDYIINKKPSLAHIYTGEAAVKFEGGDNGELKRVITSSGRIIEADFAVIGAGIKPNTDFLKNSGIKLNADGSIRTSSTMKTSVLDVYAAGDCSDNFNLVTNRHVWMPSGAGANKEGRCAALNIAGKSCIIDGVLNSSITKFFDYTIAVIGINQRQADELGFQSVSAVITKRDKAGYMPDTGTMMLKLTADKNTHEILGLQGIGEGDAAKRINTAASAIVSKMKLEEFMNIDLPYAPPYSPALDPVLNAAQAVYKKIAAL